MAFSSLYQPFIQGMEMPLSGRKREDGALKRYESVEDCRAWSMDKLERSTFIHDVVKRQYSDHPVTNLADAAKDIASIKDEEYADKVKSLLLEIKVSLRRFLALEIFRNFKKLISEKRC
jgi:hypothetical protein